MPFQLLASSKDLFRELEPRFGEARLFDMYYFCLLAGLAGNRLAPEGHDYETSDLVDYFPGEYAPKSRLIIALLLSREIRRHEVRLSQKTEVHSAIRKLIDKDAPSRLSPEGMKTMNRYAIGGGELLWEWFPDRPQHLETFLPLFHRFVQSAMGEAAGV